MWAGKVPPVTPFMGALSSLPTHTPTTRSAVKPTNQASRWSCVVPVLPATGRGNRAARPVPSRTAESNESSISRRAAGASTGAACAPVAAGSARV